MTGRKWRPASAVEEAISALMHLDMVVSVQQGRGGLDLTLRQSSWNSAKAPDWRKLVVDAVHHKEEAARWTKVVCLAKQERWTQWESGEKKFSFWDLWGMK